MPSTPFTGTDVGILLAEKLAAYPWEQEFPGFGVAWREDYRRRESMSALQSGRHLLGVRNLRNIVGQPPLDPRYIYFREHFLPFYREEFEGRIMANDGRHDFKYMEHYIQFREREDVDRVLRIAKAILQSS